MLKYRSQDIAHTAQDIGYRNKISYTPYSRWFQSVYLTTTAVTVAVIVVTVKKTMYVKLWMEFVPRNVKTIGLYLNVMVGEHSVIYNEWKNPFLKIILCENVKTRQI